MQLDVFRFFSFQSKMVRDIGRGGGETYCLSLWRIQYLWTGLPGIVQRDFIIELIFTSTVCLESTLQIRVVSLFCGLLQIKHSNCLNLLFKKVTVFPPFF
jgi:hypothetical protein